MEKGEKGKMGGVEEGGTTEDIKQQLGNISAPLYKRWETWG